MTTKIVQTSQFDETAPKTAREALQKALFDLDRTEADLAKVNEKIEAAVPARLTKARDRLTQSRKGTVDTIRDLLTKHFPRGGVSVQIDSLRATLANVTTKTSWRTDRLSEEDWGDLDQLLPGLVTFQPVLDTEKAQGLIVAGVEINGTNLQVWLKERGALETSTPNPTLRVQTVKTQLED